jgi:hypothetical protein
VVTVIFLIIAIAFAIISSVILPVSVKQAMDDLQQNSTDQAGAVVAAPFVALILVVFIFFGIAAGIVAVPFFILGLVFNVRSTILWVRVLAIIGEVLFAYEITVAVIKIIQLAVGA